jgi:nitrate/nitrite-specific signal transduction histidine kinase
VKHSHASQVSLNLKCREAPGASDAAAVELSICDNGCGFDLENAPLDHLGLGIIRERAQAVGAELQITSRPGAGAAVTVCWRGET